MKNALLLLVNIVASLWVCAQNTEPNDREQKAIASCIDQYSEARERRDTVLLKKILSADIDQLVSTGEWRKGQAAAVQGMLQSSANAPGTGTLRIEQIRMLYSTTAIVDCSYEIRNADNSSRHLWSTFILVNDKGIWKITAIRNMEPSNQ